MFYLFIYLFYQFYVRVAATQDKCSLTVLGTYYSAAT